MRLVWDEWKRLANLDKHKLDFADLTLAFFNAAFVAPGKFGRWVAIGRLETGKVAVVVFAPLGTEALSIISMRPANAKERAYAP